MKIYLVQHGESLGKEIDPQQSLNQKGTIDIERLGHFLAKKKIGIFHLYHSGKRRAEQTAEILASNLAFSGEIKFHREMEPLDDVNPIALKSKSAAPRYHAGGTHAFYGQTDW